MYNEINILVQLGILVGVVTTYKNMFIIYLNVKEIKIMYKYKSYLTKCYKNVFKNIYMHVYILSIIPIIQQLKENIKKYIIIYEIINLIVVKLYLKKKMFVLFLGRNVECNRWLTTHLIYFKSMLLVIVCLL